MRRRMGAALLAAVLVLGVVPATAGAAVLDDELGLEFPVSLANNGQVQPDIDYPWIVWKDNRECVGDEESDIYAFNFSTHETRRVSTFAGPESNPSISGDWIVYSHDTDGDDYCGIYAYNLKTKVTRHLLELDHVYMGNPAIDGDIVVFNFRDDRYALGLTPPEIPYDHYDEDIWYYDLSSDESGPVYAKEGHQREPEIGDGWVVYRQNDYVTWQNESVYAYSLDEEREVLVGQGREAVLHVQTQVTYSDPSTDDGMVVTKRYEYGEDPIAESYSIRAFDLNIEEEYTLSTVNDETWRGHPVISEDLVTWHDERTGAAEVYMYVAPAHAEFLVVPAVWDDDEDEWVKYAGRTAVDGDAEVIAWHDHRDEGVNSDGVDIADDLYAMFIKPHLEDEGIIRVAGSNRYLTSVEASKQGFWESGAEAVVIATGANWPDALGGSALAGAVRGPLLLTKPDVLPAEVRNEIVRLKAKKAYILGSTASVSAGVEASLKTLLGAGNVTRLGGTNRYETARKVADETIRLLGVAYTGEAFVATGLNFPDATGAAPVAAYIGRPILLANVPAGTVYVPTKTKKVTILGATSAVPAGIETMLKTKLGSGNVTRIAGTDRYDTAARVAQLGVNKGMRWNGVGIATGLNYPDALSGGAMLGRYGSVLLLTRPDALPSYAYTKIYNNRTRIGTAFIFGDTKAVALSVERKIADMID